MKLINLRIHNIASIEDAEIDFAGRLSEEGVFLISGVTGSGKSTILDSICLALYNSTPRLENSTMQGNTRDVKDDIGVSDVRQLLRKTAGEGFVTLLFRGNDGREYKASWSIARARKKRTGRLQNVEWRLEDKESGEVFRLQKEIESKIRETVGLDFAQFCRTTMLAQGDFTRFLSAKDNEKAAILEKITGMEIYGRIGSRIAGIASEKKEESDRLKTEAERIPVMTEEQLEECKREISSASIRLKQIDTLGKELEERRKWLENGIALKGNLKTAGESKEKAEKEINGEDYLKAKEFIRLFDMSREVRMRLEDVEESEKEIKSRGKEIEDSCGEFSLLLADRKNLEEQEIELEKERKTLEEAMEKREPVKPLLEIADRIVSQLDDVAVKSGRLVKLRSESERLLKILKEKLRPATEAAAEKLKKSEEALKAKDNEIFETDERLTALDIKGLRNDKELSGRLLSTVTNARHILAGIGTLEANRRKAEDNISEKRRTLDRLKAECLQREDDLKKSSEAMKIAKELYERQSESVDEWACKVRSHLHPGDTCPVCGSVVAGILPDDEEFRKMLRPVEDNYRKAESQHNDAIKHLAEKESMVKATSEALAEAEKDYYADNSLEETRRNLMSLLDGTDIDGEAENLKDILDDREAALASELAELKKRLQKAEEVENSLSELRKDRAGIEKRLNADKKAYDAALKAETDGKTALVNASANESAVRLEIESIRDRISTEIPKEIELPYDYQEQSLQLKEWLASEKQRMETDKERMDEIDSEVRESKRIAGVLDEGIVKLRSLVSNFRDMTAKAGACLQKDAEARMSALLTKVSVNLEVIGKEEEKISRNETLVNDFLKKNPGVDHDMLRSLSRSGEKAREIRTALVEGLESRLAKAKALISEYTSRIDEWGRNIPAGLEDYGDTELSDAELLDNEKITEAALKAEQSSLTERRALLKSQVETNDNNLRLQAESISRCKAALAEYGKWHRLDQLFGSKDGNKFRKIAQSYILGNLVAGANVYMKSLSPRYRLRVEPGSFVIMVEDAYMGYDSRAGSVISGGESFIVSLALALALADFGGPLSVDTLFIDEGFGTLSREYLDRAINTLHTLHRAGGRQVGIISHVAELRDRINAKIVLEQDGSTSSSRVTLQFS